MKDPHEKGTVMKLTREEFQKYIYAYNEDEIFYKTLYLQEKEHPETFHEYCLTLDRELIYEHRLFVPELQAEAWYPYMKEADLFQDMKICEEKAMKGLSQESCVLEKHVNIG